MDKQNKNIKHKTTPWPLFRDYLSNLISGKDMHAIEKDILKDPLESDAMDGFELFAPASIENDLNNLKTRIERKTGYYPETKLIASKQFIRIAAVALIVLFTASIAILLTRNSDDIISPSLSDNSLSKLEESPSTLQEPNQVEIDDPIEGNEITEEQTSKYKHSDYKTIVKQEIELQNTLATTTAEPDTTHLIAVLTPKTVTADKAEMISSSSAFEAELFTAEMENEELVIDVLENTEQVQTVKTLDNNTQNAQVMVRATTNAVPIAEKSKAVESAVAAKSPQEYSQYIASIKTGALNELSDLNSDFEVWFTVKVDGTLDDFDVKKGFGRRNDRKIIRIIESKEKWIPAYRNSKPIESTAVIKIDFTKK